MSLEVFISRRAEEDITRQYQWYLENADEDVSERYLTAVHQTIMRISEIPNLGARRRFAAPELEGIRSFQVARPFERHLVFYEAKDFLRVERVVHGARDLHRRLLENPEG